MDIKVEGQPGTGNSFLDTHIQRADNVAPNAREVNNHYHQPSAPKTRLATRFARLNEEVHHDIRLQKAIDDITHYRTKLDGTKGLEEKLADGGFCKRDIRRAMERKQGYFMKAQRYLLYESAQQIDNMLFAKLKTWFERHIEPMIYRGDPVSDINDAVFDKVVQPLVQLIEREGEDDQYLNYTEDDILGMLYYLTGGCHINWADYSQEETPQQ